MADNLLPGRYAVGAASVDAGGNVVTPTGATWTDNVWGDDLFFLPSQPLVPPQRVQSVNGDGELVLAYPWPGDAAVEEPYEVRYVGIIERSTAQSRRVLEQLGDVKAWYDIIVEDDAARLALESPTSPLRSGYRVLVEDDGVIWAKKSAAYGDWVGPVEFKGDKGSKGWSPQLVSEADGERRVLKLAGYVGGEGVAPTDNVGQYLKADGTWTSTIGDAVDFRGEGFTFMGAYSGATAYATGNIAREGGSSWIALQPTTGNAPPTLPMTSNAYWALLAQKGNDGTGTIVGLVAGDGIAIDNTDPNNPIISFDGVAGPVKADEETAIGGTDNEDYMTSLRVNQAIKSLLGVEPAVARWKGEKFSSRVFYGGLDQSAAAGSVDGGTTGRTLAIDNVKLRIRQKGFVRTVKVSLFSVGAASLANSLRFVVLRKNGTTYTLVSQSELITPAGVTTLQTFTLASPMACLPGDVIGVWLKGNASGNSGLRSGAYAGGPLRYLAGTDVTGTWSDIADYAMDLRFEGVPPFVVSTGDSIIEGTNGGASLYWLSHYDAGPAGTLSSNPLTGVEALIAGLEHQNFAQGGATWANTATKVTAINAAGAKAVIAAAGVNDVAAGRTWSAIEADMNACKASLASGTRLFICEVLPWTAGNDTQAAAIRSLNVNYAAWCIANGATLVRAHDAMAQVRGSTGQLDDLKTAYNQDGVHLTPAGVTAFSALIADGMNSVLWL